MYHYRNVYHLRWEKLPGLPWVRRGLERWRGKEWVQSLRTPYIYERPNFLTGLALWIMAAVGLGFSCLQRRRDRRDTRIATLRRCAPRHESSG